MLTAITTVLAAAWVASRWIGVYYGSDEFGLGVGIESGTLNLIRGLHQFGSDAVGWQLNWDRTGRDWMWLPEFTWVLQYEVLMIPLWMPLLPCLLGAAWMWQGEWRTGAGVGACTGCGYDLAGIAKGAKCPECGATAS